MAAKACILLALMSSMPTSQSLSSVVPKTRIQKISAVAGTTGAIRQRKRTTTRRRPKQVKEVEDPEFDWGDSMTSDVLELQQSTGSEILDSKLQSQLDGISHPNQFLDRHVADATDLEKIAMSSVTQQLPKPALDALSARANDSMAVRGRKSKDATLRYADHRVSREEEIELAQTVQKGAALEAIKIQAEEKEGRTLNRQEWAELAGLSPKELRREVSNYRKAKHLLVTANLGLVGAVVNQIWAKRKHAYMGISKEELVQEGSLGLLRAAELFDPSRGLRFSTYAVVWIKGVLSNSHIQELVRLPQREKLRWRKIQIAMDDLAKEGNDGPKSSISFEKISELTGISVKDVTFTYQKMEQAQSLLSLDYEQSSQSRSGTESNSVNKIHNDKAMQEEDIIERTQLRADLIAALAHNLDAREARLMRLRYGLSDGVPRSLTECAEAMGLSYTRVNQLSRGCLKKLREAAEAESLQEYLLTIA
eukprot:CAMPEP_0172473562 /NCGR_PEP_ID=MMETSP1065-20121228/68913_1 /TAXON_ID=265537 /ORGANISM="Amphiprora paludosa, Strain CCMP125" /LENGTH=478 /DNA_ID=CAMNT_0013231737 /DNA_START=240 /DNA_END=1676 /DNA_ORIENTATION=-